MPTNREIQYTIRGISPETDTFLRQQAKILGVSLNRLIVDRLVDVAQQGLPIKRRSLQPLLGQWVNDPEFEEALADQRQIDQQLWK